MTKVSSESYKKALDKAYKESGHNAYFGNGFMAGYHYGLECNLTLNAWIKVEDGLPLKGSELLVYVDNTYTGDKWITTGVSYDGSRWNGNGHANVTHWQPLVSIPDVESKSIDYGKMRRDAINIFEMVKGFNGEADIAMQAALEMASNVLELTNMVEV